MNQEKIIQAIADWIEENEGDLTACALPSEHKDEIAELIFAAAIAPHLEAATEYPYDELFDHMSNEHKLTLIQGELGDIIHIARGKSKQGQDPNFTEWLDRYFVKEDMVTRYRSKSAGAIYLEKEVLELYNRTK